VDGLGLDRVAVIGQSGGGPHALAVAHQLGDRVTTLCLLSTGGPAAEPWASEALKNPLMRSTHFLAKHAPSLVWLPLVPIKAMMGSPKRFDKLMDRQAAKATPRERTDLTGPESKFISLGLQEAFSHGLGGTGDEFKAIGEPWGFRVEDISAPTDMWHGSLDKSCPIGMARAMAERIPNATMHELSDIGHGFFGAELDEAMATVRIRGKA
jgi:pimeloyl-ACP methyl ester carboxylesterase